MKSDVPKKKPNLADKDQGIHTNFWVWASKLVKKQPMQEAKNIEPAGWAADEDTWDKAKKAAGKSYSDADSAFWPSVATIYKNMGGTIGKGKKSKSKESKQAVTDGQDQITKILVENPQMTAPTFVNLIKSQGFKIVKEDFSDLIDGAKKKEKEIKASIEANNSSGHAPVVRSHLESMRISQSRMLESSASDNGIGITKFKVALITEGLGNFVDGYYYTKESIESAVPIFEGKKIFANHPTRTEEEDRPERDINDVVGHFENLRVEQLQDGRHQLIADANILPDKDYERYRALMRHAVEFSKKYPDKDFVGLSINADGYNTPMRISEFITKSEIPSGAMPKIKEAMEKGLEVVKVVPEFKDAVSCDLVTEAGAGGKVLEMIEGEKSHGRSKNTR